jgi:hypothetical protein
MKARIRFMAAPALAPAPRVIVLGVHRADGALDGDVQVPEAVLAGNLQAAPDGRRDVQQPDAELEDGLGHCPAFAQCDRAAR